MDAHWHPSAPNKPLSTSTQSTHTHIHTYALTYTHTLQHLCAELAPRNSVFPHTERPFLVTFRRDVLHPLCTCGSWWRLSSDRPAPCSVRATGSCTLRPSARLPAGQRRSPHPPFPFHSPPPTPQPGGRLVKVPPSPPPPHLPPPPPTQIEQIKRTPPQTERCRCDAPQKKTNRAADTEKPRGPGGPGGERARQPAGDAARSPLHFSDNRMNGRTDGDVSSRLCAHCTHAESARARARTHGHLIMS